MRRSAGVLAAAIAVLMLSGCGGLPGIVPQSREEAVPVDQLACTDPFGQGAADAPVAGTLPEGFEPVAVLRCGATDAREQPDGAQWSGTPVERLEGDLQPFLEAIGAPSDPPWNGACTAIGVVVDDLWAIDADDRYVRLSYPSTGCGQPKDDGIAAALAALEIVGETFTPVSIVETPAAREAGCETRASVGAVEWAIPSDVDRQILPAETVSPEGGALIPYEYPVLVAAADSVKLCVYASGVQTGSGPHLRGDAGVFSEVRELGAVDGTAALAAVAEAPAAGVCEATATRFVVAHPATAGATTAPFTVELDGCTRVIDPGFRTLAASPELLGILGP